MGDKNPKNKAKDQKRKDDNKAGELKKIQQEKEQKDLANKKVKK